MVEEPIPRYYCHVCNSRFDTPAENFTCPNCSGGFIEEVPSNEETSSSTTVSETPDETTAPQNTLLPPPQGFYLIRWVREPQPELNQDAGQSISTTPQLESIITDFFRSFGMVHSGEDGTTVQIIVGNPSDYTWSRGEFDGIVTQLLDQIDDNGTPPLPNELFESIPVVKVTSEILSSEPMCSVCWDDFIIDEEVRRLVCGHLFHDHCLRPWLDLHSTCPMCRHYLGNDPDYINSELENANNMTTLQQLFQEVQRSRTESVVSDVVARGTNNSEASQSNDTPEQQNN